MYPAALGWYEGIIYEYENVYEKGKQITKFLELNWSKWGCAGCTCMNVANSHIATTSYCPTFSLMKDVSIVMSDIG
jgi:hypothetical protein